MANIFENIMSSFFSDVLKKQNNVSLTTSYNIMHLVMQVVLVDVCATNAAMHIRHCFSVMVQHPGGAMREASTHHLQAE